MRFFYQSPRYSEDMDLDTQKTPLHRLQKIVMDVLASKTLLMMLKPFQIEAIRPPDLQKAKQTETVQRFKVHLFTAAGEDLFTKIEFSRRGLSKGVRQEAVSDEILFACKQPPLIISHYPAETALAQKVEALLGRSAPQARDIFDIFILRPQVEGKKKRERGRAARDKLLGVGYPTFRDTVCAYLDENDRAHYDSPAVWEEILRKVGEILS